MANDSDLFNRWQAAQDYATRVLVQAVKTVRGGQKPKPAREFVEALGVTLADETLEPGYRAQFILLPRESDLARVIGARRRSAGHPQGAQRPAQGDRHPAGR